MQRALQQARCGQQAGEVPVGAVLVMDDECVAQAFNQPISLCDPSAHAEILVMRKAANTLRNYRLLNSTLYVTLEPCVMCVGAMIHARISRLVYAASDPKTGAVNGALELLSHPVHNHRVAVTAGICAEEASALLKAFFQQKR